MAIANPLDCTTYAKDSTGEALPSQSGLADNEIKFSNPMGTNNNGNVVGPPTDGTASYVGRLVHIRKGDGDEEVRYIVAESGTGPVTCTVHEDWDSNPVSGDTYFIPYGPTDLDSKGNAFKELLKRVTDWAASDIIEVSSGGGLALLDGHSIETTDNSSTTEAEIIVYSGGTFYTGFLAAGKPVSGGYIVPTPAVAGEFAFDVQPGGLAYLYDFFMSCVYNNKVIMDGTAILRRAKIFKGLYTMDLTGAVEIYDSLFQGLATTSDYIIVDGSTDIQELNLVACYGLRTPNDASPDTITVKNTAFINLERFITVYDEKTWKIVNPTWVVDIDTQNDIDFDITTPNNEQVQELFSFDTLITTPAGVPIQTARPYIFEGLFAGNVPHYGATDSNGEWSVDILKRVFMNPDELTTTTTTSTTDDGVAGLLQYLRGDFALHVYKHTYVPFVGALTVDAPIDQPIGMSIDAAVSETNQATALSAGSGITMTRHATGETDPRPMKVLKYDGGTGSAPTVGETITQATQNATGVVVEYLGDGVSGTLVLETWNGTEFVDNDSYLLTGGTSSFSAKANITGGFYEEYTWEIDCNNLSLQTVYDYLAAFMASDPATYSQILDIVEWGEDEQSQLLYSGTAGYYTERNINLTEGVWLHSRGSGTVEYFTADDGTQYIPEVQRTHKLTGLVPKTEVTYVEAGTQTVLFHVEDVTASGETNYSYIYGGDVDVDILIHHECYEFIAIDDVTLGNADAEIPVAQDLDVNVVMARCFTTTSTTTTSTTTTP